ncbi:hypothetical protein CRE_22110 [Caenorhabditis remanei]|uniref:Uncharacterized protein n=1 Tax=Caenorhabditis remanei TaxID=31234 RepID=E3NFL9_CAERE|nr:hypothetical protein CRE_22110 [Caenorhabditis remanei]
MCWCMIENDVQPISTDLKNAPKAHQTILDIAIELFCSIQIIDEDGCSVFLNILPDISYHGDLSAGIKVHAFALDVDTFELKTAKDVMLQTTASSK